MSLLVDRYGFINAKLRTRLGRLLSDSFLTRIARASNLVEAMPLLREGGYGSIETVYTETGDLKLAELELYTQEISLYTEVQRYVDTQLSSFIDALLLKYEIETMKNVIRLWFDQVVRKRDISYGVGYLYRKRIINDLNLDSIMYAPDIDTLLQVLKHTPYQILVAKYVGHIETQKNIYPVEMELDRYFFQTLDQAAALLPKQDREIVSRMIGVEIDLENITRIIRLKNFYKSTVDEILGFTISGGRKLDRRTISKAGKAGSGTDLLSILVDESYPEFSGFLSRDLDTERRMVLVESLLQDIQRREVRKMLMGDPFTIGMILSYFFLRKSEMQKLITLLNAKNYGMPEDRIVDKIY